MKLTEIRDLYKDTESFKKMIELRYALIPYIYSEFMKAALNDGMYIKPLSFEYRTDKRARETEDQLLVGESIMIAPVYQQNKTGRYVYLPEDMKLLRFRSYNDFDEVDLPAGDHYITANLNEVLVFLRPGHILPLTTPAPNVASLNLRDLSYIGYKAAPGSFTLYTDEC